MAVVYHNSYIEYFGGDTVKNEIKDRVQIITKDLNIYRTKKSMLLM